MRYLPGNCHWFSTLPMPLNSTPARCRHYALPGVLWERGLRRWEIKCCGVFLLQREKGCGFGEGAAAREGALVSPGGCHSNIGGVFLGFCCKQVDI